MRQPRIILVGLAILVAAGAILATAFMLGGMKVFQSMDHAQTLAWISLPYLVLIGISRLAVSNTLSASVALAGTLMTSWVGLDSLYHGFYKSSDAQSGLVLVVLPVVQWVCCGLTVAAILAMLFMKWLVLPERGKKATVG